MKGEDHAARKVPPPKKHTHPCNHLATKAYYTKDVESTNLALDLYTVKLDEWRQLLCGKWAQLWQCWGCSHAYVGAGFDCSLLDLPIKKYRRLFLYTVVK
jgi:hypothetical protein